MAVLPPKTGTRRRPTMKGVMQQDVVNGKTRVRKWPEPRLSNQTPEQLAQQEWFRQANWAFKYLAPNSQAALRAATHRTSLYPRDLFTIMAANGLFAMRTEDGKVLYPMPTRQAVSESLDTIGQIEGYMLVRGSQFWEAVPVPVAPTAPPLTQILNQVITSPTPFVDVDVRGYDEAVINFWDVTASVSDHRSIRFSTDNGVSFWSTSGDYKYISPTGVLSNNDKISAHQNASSNARTGTILIPGLRANLTPRTAQVPNNTNIPAYIFTATDQPITHIRLYTVGGNMTGGRLAVQVK